MKQLPNLITLLNLVFGCLAIVCILQPGENIAYLDENSALLINLPAKLAWGSVFVGCAALVDFLDGFVARLLRLHSPVGRELDSLADVVTFGVAPGMILYQLLRMSYLRVPSAFDTPVIAFLPALLVPCASAYRLARFNVSTNQDKHFVGVPTPAAGLFIASLPLIVFFRQFHLSPWIIDYWTLYGIILLTSYLMISPFAFLSLKFRSASIKENWPAFLLGLVAVVGAVVLHWVAVPVVFGVYVLLSLTLGPRTGGSAAGA